METEITKEEIKAFLNDRYREPTERLDAFRQVCEERGVPIILKETESLLRFLCDLKKPKKILEIGTAIGYSATFFATVCPDAVIITVEKDETSYLTAKLNIEKAGLDHRVRIVFGEGQEQIEKMSDEGVSRVDMLFLDAGKSHYRRFLESALPMLEDGALIISDNILMKGMTALSEELDPRGKHKTNILGMKDHLDFITTDHRFSTTLQAVGDGIALSLYRRNG